MVCLIPDEMLQKLLCSVCEKYLSPEPVKVYSNRGMKCGRCVKENDGGVKSVYNYVVNHFLFPCINRFEGCKHVLRVDDVTCHELMCRSETYDCPYETDEFAGSAYEMLLHFQKIHRDYFLVKNEICIKATDEMSYHYLLRQNNFLFLIGLRFDSNNFRFHLECHLLGEKFSTAQIIKNVKIISSKTNDVLTHYVRDTNLNESKQIEVQLPEEALPIISENMSYIIKFDFKTICFSSNLKNQTRTIQRTVTKVNPKFPRIKFQEDLDTFRNFRISSCGSKILNTEGNYTITMLCWNCNQYIMNVYCCTELKHLSCYRCATLIPECSDYEDITNIEVIRQLYSLLKFACKWECGGYFNATDIEEHQRCCTKSVTVNCPVENCTFLGTLGDLEPHFDHEHCKYNLVFKDCIYNYCIMRRYYMIIHDCVILFYYKGMQNSDVHYQVNKCFPISDKNYLLGHQVLLNNAYMNGNNFSIPNNSCNKIIIEKKQENCVNICVFC